MLKQPAVKPSGEIPAMNFEPPKPKEETPGFTIFDGGGRFNSQLEITSTELTRDSRWKKQQVVCILPAASKVHTKTAVSWMSMVRPPNQAFVTYLAQGMEVGEAYSKAIENILAQPILREFDYILTIEHDNTPPPDGLLLLLESMENNPDLDAISGLYFTKGFGSVAQIWGNINNPIPNFVPQPPVPGELIECYGIGMGFALWRMEMFKDKRLPNPLFKTIASAQGAGTQDLSFWGEAKKNGYRCAVDCRCAVGHVDETGFIW